VLLGGAAVSRADPCADAGGGAAAGVAGGDVSMSIDLAASTSIVIVRA
jgi:hypothetical protein